MSYQSKEELPETLRKTMPEEAQTVYVNAYNEALKGDLPTAGGQLSNESAAHAVAWQAVELEFEKSADGKWHRRGAAPEEGEEEESEGGLLKKIKNLF
jgi:cation transport regulator